MRRASIKIRSEMETYLARLRRGRSWWQERDCEEEETRREAKTEIQGRM